MENNYIRISAKLYCELKRKITELEIERDRLIDDKLLAEAKIQDLKEQVSKLTRILDAII